MMKVFVVWAWLPEFGHLIKSQVCMCMADPSTAVWTWKDPWHLLARHSSPKEISDGVKRPCGGKLRKIFNVCLYRSTHGHILLHTSIYMWKCAQTYTQDNCIQFDFSKSTTTATTATKAKKKPTVVACTYSLGTQQVKSREPGVQGYLHPWLHIQFEATMGHMKSYLKKSEGENLC